MMFQAIIISFALATLGLAQEPIEPPSDITLEAEILPNETLPVTSQIVGGVPADIENYPYQVQLLYNGVFSCGGSILSKKTILTAAHCLYGFSTNSLSIRAGSSFKRGGTVISAASYKSHPSFSTRTFDYDIAVITLSQPLTYGPGIGRIELATTIPDDWTRLTISGWGALYENGPLADQLQVGRVPKVNWGYCSRRYRLTDRMVCAGWGFRDTCQGDSGGPLTVSGKQVGVTSFGTGCARFGYPGVYASVPALFSWIRSNTILD